MENVLEGSRRTKDEGGPLGGTDPSLASLNDMVESLSRLEAGNMRLLDDIRTLRASTNDEKVICHTRIKILQI